jgi:quercetin dioxygenase-like cupin family protein
MSSPSSPSPNPAPAAVNPATLVDYAPGAIVSRTIAEGSAGTITLFAFDQGQGLSEHSAPFDAHVLILEGQASLRIGGQDVRASAGQLVTMPANVPHSLAATARFKMLLIMIRS